MYVVLDFKGNAAPVFVLCHLITSTWPCHSSLSIHNSLDGAEWKIDLVVLVHNMQQARLACNDVVWS